MKTLTLQTLFGLATILGIALASPDGLQASVLIALVIALVLALPNWFYLLLTAGLFGFVILYSPIEFKFMAAVGVLLLVLFSRIVRQNLVLLGLLGVGVYILPNPLRYAAGAILLMALLLSLWRVMTRPRLAGPNFMENESWRVLLLPGRGRRTTSKRSRREE